MPGVQPAMSNNTTSKPPSIAKDHPWVAFDAARFRVVEARAIGPTISTYRQVVMAITSDDNEGPFVRSVQKAGPDEGAGGDGLKIAEHLSASIARFGSIEPWGFRPEEEKK